MATAALKFPVKARHSLRQRLEAAIERAIATLDALDGDPDLELEPDLEDGHDAEEDAFQNVGDYGLDQTGAVLGW
jgi:hypothetical protein